MIGRINSSAFRRQIILAFVSHNSVKILLSPQRETNRNEFLSRKFKDDFFSAALQSRELNVMSFSKNKITLLESKFLARFPLDTYAMKY